MTKSPKHSRQVASTLLRACAIALIGAALAFSQQSPPSPLPAFFSGEGTPVNSVYLLNFPNGTPFGYYYWDTTAGYIYHYDMGVEWYVDANDGAGGVYFSDAGLNSILYTTPSTFPYIYVYSPFGNSANAAWFWYEPNSAEKNHYTANPRYMVNLSTNTWYTTEANTTPVPIPPVTPTTLSINGGGSIATVNLGTQATYAFTYHDNANGATDIAGSEIYFMNGASYCSVSWTASNNQVTVQSGSCSATPISAVYSSSDPTAITVTVGITVNSAPAGTYQIETTASDDQGLASSEGDVGTLTVNASQMYTLSGQVMLYPAFSNGAASGSPLTGLQVNLSGGASGSATTDSTGHYTFMVAAGGSYTVAPQGSAYTFAPASMSVQNLASSATLPFAAAADQGCMLSTTPGETTTRTSGNQATGSSTIYPTSVVGDWTITVTTTLLFTPSSGGTEQSIQHETNSFNLTPSSPTGSNGTVTINAASALEPYGAGSYRTRGDYSGTCGGTAIPPSTGTYYSPALTIQRPTITPPAGSPYDPGYYAIWYLGGQPSIDGYYTSATMTGNANLGTCSGCNPSYQWFVETLPLGYESSPLTFGSSGTTQTTITSTAPSGGAAYDVGIVFWADGFYSDEFWININTPVGTVIYKTATVPNNSCLAGSTPFASGYDSTYTYEIYDLWGNVLAPITVNEQNDAFTDDYPTAIAGWHYDVANFTVDDTWPGAVPPAGGWDPPQNPPQNTINTFTDFIGASSCDLSNPVWYPQTQAPQGLNIIVQDTPQYLFAGSATTAAGVLIRTNTQTWYTDHGTCTQGPTKGGPLCQ